MKPSIEESNSERISVCEVRIDNFKESLNKIEGQVSNHIPTAIKELDNKIDCSNANLIEKINISKEETNEKISKSNIELVEKINTSKEETNEKINQANIKLAGIMSVVTFAIQYLFNK